MSQQRKKDDERIVEILTDNIKCRCADAAEPALAMAALRASMAFERLVDELSRRRWPMLNRIAASPLPPKEWKPRTKCEMQRDFMDGNLGFAQAIQDRTDNIAAMVLEQSGRLAKLDHKKYGGAVIELLAIVKRIRELE